MTLPRNEKHSPPFVEKISTVFLTFRAGRANPTARSQSLLVPDAFEFSCPQSLPFFFQSLKTFIDPSTRNAEQAGKVCETQ
jgi:hypothetical protein